MIEHVDAEAGIAVFRQGRSLCIRLRGTLNDGTARSAARLIRPDRNALRLRLECSGVDGSDGSGPGLLATALLAWAGGAGGRTVHFINVAEILYRGAAWHPLRSFSDPDEVLFFDPDREPAWEPAPSRH